MQSAGNPFAASVMAAGYARFRPPLHGLILERVARRVDLSAGIALDVGCGAGLSTAALNPIAARRIGIDPAEAMLRHARGIDPDANWIVGRAEALPLRAR